tara:strand:- start:267 stop:683 length:417 start_codon:yes stop_codon:yes gene_type:complete
MVQTKEEKAAYDKAYRVKHKEKRAAYRKEYCEANKEALSAKKKAYRETPEAKETLKAYSETPSGKKSYRIGNWKHKGLICDDVDALYEKYLNTTNCENCDIELTVDRHPTKTTRCMDHDHVTGLFRNVLCHPCNIKRR